MKILHNVGPRVNSNYNTVEEILACNGPISFDGVYRNVWENREVLRPKLNGAILFITGSYIGKDNSFDTGMPLERFCDWNEIMELVTYYGCVLGWHSWTHRNMTLLSDSELTMECQAPIPMNYFAYPYGDVDSRVAAAVKAAGYSEAYSVSQGNGSVFQLKRTYLNH